MRWPVVAIALVLVLIGLVFFFQGIGVLPGSFMTGRPEWAVIGGGLMVGGALLIAFRGRRAR